MDLFTLHIVHHIGHKDFKLAGPQEAFDEWEILTKTRVTAGRAEGVSDSRSIRCFRRWISRNDLWGDMMPKRSGVA